MGRLCKDQLANELFDLFREAAYQGYIDDAVVQAKRRLEDENKRMKCADLEKLFDGQLATLKDRGCPEQILEALRNGKQKVLDHAQTITVANGNLAFAPVITPLYLGYHGIVSMIRHNGKSGYTYLDPTQITDEENVPARLYYHFDIEDGTNRLGKKPEVYDREIRVEKRLRSTAAEIVSIGTHTNVLSKHYMDAVGSRYGSDGVPVLWLSGGGPVLSWDYLGSSFDRWGAASGGSRLEL